MRGTVTFERLNCGGSLNLRILLNDAVYRESKFLRRCLVFTTMLTNYDLAVPSCKSGPGSSCPLQRYDRHVLAQKWAQAGSFASFCGIPKPKGRKGVTFFTDLTLPSIQEVQP
jgi:acid phosphatase